MKMSNTKSQTGLQMKYFVLKPKGKDGNDVYAQASRHAMMTYARYIQRDNPELAKNIVDWVNDCYEPSDGDKEMGRILHNWHVHNEGR
jgi:hypothetical protein